MDTLRVILILLACVFFVIGAICQKNGNTNAASMIAFGFSFVSVVLAIWNPFGPSGSTGVANPQPSYTYSEPVSYQPSSTSNTVRNQSSSTTSRTATSQSSNTSNETKAQTVSYRIPDSALSYNGHYYYIYDDVTEFKDAVQNCNDRGGYIAVINNKAENEELFQYMKRMGYEEAFFGLGYNSSTKKWVYLDGSEASYTDWGMNSKNIQEPNNSGGKEFNVQLDIHMKNGHWNDARFGAEVRTPDGDLYKDRYAYICEWD